MIMVHNDEELKRLGFRLLVTVHDEMFGEAPTENSVRAGERLSEVMVEAAKVKCGAVKWKCDEYVVKRWYLDEFAADVLKNYNKCKDIEQIKNDYSAINPVYIEQMCNETFDCNKFENI